MSKKRLAAQIAREVGTPALVVDLDVVERNIAKAQAYCNAAKIKSRPHIKTHKSAFFAKMQIDSGATGITCQKLGEAEIMAAAGMTDILVTYNLLGEEKVGRLGRLLQTTNVTAVADNPVTISGLPRAAEIGGRTLDVVIECDTGRKRAGVESVGEAIELARVIASTPGLSFAGFVFYPPDQQMSGSQRFLDDALRGVREHGLEPRIVSTGGTPNLSQLGDLKGMTEHRAGTYIFNDRMMMAKGMASLEDCAVTVVTTIVSRAGPERGIMDAGSKTLTSDTGGGLEGFGHVIEYPNIQVAGFAEEHGFLDLSKSNDRPQVGTVMNVIPNHVCVVVNMFDRIVLTRDFEIIGDTPIEARGKII